MKTLTILSLLFLASCSSMTKLTWEDCKSSKIPVHAKSEQEFIDFCSWDEIRNHQQSMENIRIAFPESSPDQ